MKNAPDTGASESAAPGSAAAAPPRTLRIGVWARQQQKWGRDLIAGVFRYTSGHAPCEIQFLQLHPGGWDGSFFRHWKPDGLILGCELPPWLSSPRRIDRPVVLVNVRATQVNAPVVAELWIDERAIARGVAEQFLRRSLPNFAYVGEPEPNPENGFSELRRQFFEGRLRESGRTCEVFRAPPEIGADWGLEEPALAKWLSELPKPCGLMTCSDKRGKAVLDACRVAGVRVPEQISVISVDNDPVFCETAMPPLSSVEPDSEAAGYRAAELLCRALASGEVPEKRTAETYATKAFVERASSQDYKGAARLVAAARDYIRRNACAGIRTADVARALKVSVRLLHLRFSEVGDTTVHGEIERVRLDRVRELLRTTRLPIGEIGTTCGFASEANLKVLFKRRFGCTMRDWRRDGEQS
ncbi:MAG: substrate-binding domain-containing protein [Kiritimatiellae bacterium]|nr:substrate-binding domain-containing protein [Kiritimatiellia bacterium]